MIFFALVVITSLFGFAALWHGMVKSGHEIPEGGRSSSETVVIATILLVNLSLLKKLIR